jgi:hypothetical protein
MEHPGVLLQGAQVCFICEEITAAVEAEREAKERLRKYWFVAEEEVARLRADNSNLRDDLTRAWGLTDADTEAARTAGIERLREALERIAGVVTYSPDEEELVKIAREVLGRKGKKL